MVQIDIPIAFGVSCFFADMARRQLQEGGAEYCFHAFSRMVIFQAFFFLWIPLYFLMNFFGWETTHMWWHADDIMAYPFYIPGFTLIFWLVAVLGFLLGDRLVRAGRVWANRAVYIAILLYSAVWIFAQPGRTMRLGTYSEWRDGEAPWFYEDSTFLVMFIIAMVVWIAGLIIIGALLRRAGRHLDTAPAVEPSLEGE